MKTINKIAIVQVSFCISGAVSYTLLDIELKNIISTYVTITIGYLYGFWHSKN